MITPDALSVVVVGRSPEKMDVAVAVLESRGFVATGVFSEQEALRAVAAIELFAVIAGGSIDQPAQDRLRAAAAPKGAVLITAHIGHDDPEAHFATHVIPKLIAARDARCEGTLPTIDSGSGAG